MDQDITGGIQHLQLITEEEEEISISTTSSDLLKECTQAFNSTQRIAWNMGSDLRIVDVGIKVVQFKFSSSFQTEWLPNFCFICGVLGHGEKHLSGFQGKSECHRLFGDWTRESSGFKGVFEKHRAASSGGSEERKEEDTGVQHSPMAASQASLGTEQVRHSVALSNHISSNITNRGHGSRSVVLSMENQSNDARVCLLSPAPFSDVHPRVSQKSSVTGKKVEVKALDMGFQMFSSEAQKSPSLKLTSKPSPSNEPTNTPLCLKSGNLKRVARAQGKKPQNFNMQAQDYCWALGFVVEGGV